MKNLKMSIERMTSLYPNEWLLVEVKKTDEATGNPLEGLLIAHSADRKTIRERLLRCEGCHHALIFTGPPIPEGTATALLSR